MKAIISKWTLILFLATVVSGLHGQGLIKFNNLATNSGMVFYYSVLLSQDVNMQLRGGASFSSVKNIHTWLLSDNSANGINVAPGRFADPSGSVYAVPGVEPGELAYIEIAAWVGDFNSLNDAVTAGAPIGAIQYIMETGAAGAAPSLTNMPVWGLGALETPAVVYAQIKITTNATGKVTLSWAVGTLVSSPNVNGPYTPVSGATSPYVVTPASAVFYRLQQ